MLILKFYTIEGQVGANVYLEVGVCAGPNVNLVWAGVPVQSAL